MSASVALDALALLVINWGVGQVAARNSKLWTFSALSTLVWIKETLFARLAFRLVFVRLRSRKARQTVEGFSFTNRSFKALKALKGTSDHSSCESDTINLDLSKRVHAISDFDTLALGVPVACNYRGSDDRLA